MTEHEAEFTPTLEEAGRRRADLHAALVDVEKAISRAAIGRETDWAKEVLVHMEDLGRAIREHIEVAERPAGLYDEIAQKAPRVADKIDRLRNEHPALRDEANKLTNKLRDAGIGQAWPLEDAREDLQRLLGKIVRHRQLGSDLVWEAYNLDIGGVD